jgi:hypothetical protein
VRTNVVGARGDLRYLREAARPIDEADRHAKKELQKKVRGVLNLERQVEQRPGPVAEARGYFSAVRSAVTDDGRPPPDAGGLRLHGRLGAIAAGLGRPEAQGGSQSGWGGSRGWSIADCRRPQSP